MLSGIRRRIAIALLATPAICYAALEVDSLLAGLARPAPATTAFIEVRFSKLLDKPLVAQGQLQYGGPTELARVVTAPFQERTQISGDTVSIEREGQKPRRFSLRRVPELRGVLGSFAAVLSGDRIALERDFNIELAGELSHWEMRLTPKSTRVGRHLRGLVIQGADSEPRCISVVEPDGDGSIMLVGEAANVTLPQQLQRPWLESYCANPES